MSASLPHETYRELLALDQYDELEPAERASLQRHLEACADCRALADELAGTLGVLRASEESAGVTDVDLPPGWPERSERLRDVARASPRWTGPRTVLAFVAGLAAGLLCMLLRPEPESPSAPLERGQAQAPSPTPVLSDTTGATVASGPRTAPFLVLTEPPPRTTSRGPLAHLSSR